MTQIVSYLNFNGNCREAMRFYQSCLGGQLRLQMVGEAATHADMPREMLETVLQATLTKGAWMLMGSDLIPEHWNGTDNRITLMLLCDQEAEARTYFQRLAEHGKVEQALQINHWGALTGLLKDRFGIRWQLYWKN